MVRVIASKDKRIPIGSVLTTINDQQVDDFLEFQFYNDASKARQILIKSNGKSRRLVYKPNQPVAITLQPPRYRQCINHCDFCFINGLPKYLRKELYFRDDDYRLSFLFGNFLSLTNVTKSDIARIGRLRLSPLYVSVHTTDPKLRTKLFKNERAGLILETLKALADNDIRVHCQIVVIPRVTGGKDLIRTIEELSQLHPAVASIGIVPVGKTKYIKGIPAVSKKTSKSTIGIGHRFHDRFRKKYQRGIVYLADEFYIKAGHPIPDRFYYDDFPQYENGIGMVRTLLEEIKQLKKIKKCKGRHLLLTGVSAYPYLRMLSEKLAPNIILNIKAVTNDFFGKTVTVSGLISAHDIMRKIKKIANDYDRIILPPNCVNDSNQFLDNNKITDKRVLVAPQSIKELLTCLQ